MPVKNASLLLLIAAGLALGCSTTVPTETSPVDLDAGRATDAVAVDAGDDEVSDAVDNDGAPHDNGGDTADDIDAKEDIAQDATAPADTDASDTDATNTDASDPDAADTEDGDDGDDDASDDASAGDTAPPPPPNYSCGDAAVYDPVPIGAWKVCRAKVLKSSKPKVSAEAEALLATHLQLVEKKLNAAVVKQLQTVRIWLEKDIPAFPGGVYHPSPGWLANNGYPKYWAKGVQIGNAANYLSWTKIQPAIVLHELAHAWHHQVVGYGQKEIGAAFAAAVASGAYAKVKYAGGGSKKAYALTNKQEYFAELTEAFFWQNDFYPFNKAQLATFDPQGYAAVDKAWTPPKGP